LGTFVIDEWVATDSRSRRASGDIGNTGDAVHRVSLGYDLP
jgi:hypothetical protein